MNEQKISEELLNHATTAQQQAHAPYSNFYVGAALITPDHKITSGCNIESVSYGLTICAERVALFNAISQGYKTFTHMLLTTNNGVSPCGACRQVLYEFAPNALLFIAQDNKIIQQLLIKDLLPHAFCTTQLDTINKGEPNEHSK